jgi:hypothetical protein
MKGNIIIKALPAQDNGNEIRVPGPSIRVYGQIVTDWFYTIQKTCGPHGALLQFHLQLDILDGRYAY